MSSTKNNRCELLLIALLMQLGLYLVQGIIVGVISDHGKQPMAYMIASVITVPFVFLLPLWFYCKYSGYRPFKNDFGVPPEVKLKTQSGLKAIIEFIAGASAVISAVNVLGMLTDSVLSLFTELPPSTLPQNATEFVLIFVKTVLLAPILEQLLFRGAIVHAFNDKSDRFKIIISAVLFALMHYRFTALPYAFGAGIVISFFAVRKKSIKYGLALHLVSNLTTFIFSVLVSELDPRIYSIVSAAAFWFFLAVTLAGGAQLFLSMREKAARNEPKVYEPMPTEIIFYMILAAIFSVLNF